MVESGQGCSTTEQNEAGRRRRRCRPTWGGGPETGALAQTKAGLTTFRLENVSWLECRPLAALVCSLQRPNAGISQSHDALGFGGAQLTLGQFLRCCSRPRRPGGGGGGGGVGGLLQPQSGRWMGNDLRLSLWDRERRAMEMAPSSHVVSRVCGERGDRWQWEDASGQTEEARYQEIHSHGGMNPPCTKQPSCL
ncbi:hypothetical protein VTG60DRAFT_837 [Thermothelomyces hinnuleus]